MSQGSVFPPGPGADVDLERMRLAPLEFVTGLREGYGDITRHIADGDTVYLLNRPDLARHVLKDNGANYDKRRTPDDAMLRPLLGNGLLTSDGEDWARQRRQCAPAFRPAAVRTFDRVITDATLGMLDRWQPSIGSGTPLAVDHHLTSLTLAIVSRAILGADVDGIGEGFGRAVDTVNKCIGHYVPPDDPDPEDTRARQAGFTQARMLLNAITSMLVAARREGRFAGPDDGPTLLDALLASEAQMPPGELREQVLTLIMAGHETTAKSLTWTLYLLDQHPDEAARLYDEVDAVLDGRVPTSADLPALGHCRRAIEEAMRLFPPVWLTTRRARGADVLDGYDVEPDTLVCVSQWVLHRHPRYWDAPEQFRPDRFRDEERDRRPSHLYLPFGGGDRVCIGRHFALVEATLALATMLSRVRLELVPGHPVEPEALVTLRPRFGMSMTATKR